MPRRHPHPNFTAAHGGVRMGPRSAVQVNFAATQGGGRRHPRFQPPRGSPAVFPHDGFTNLAAVNGGPGRRAHFHPRESAAIFLDDVCILDSMDRQFNGGAVRVQPPADVFSGGVFVPNSPPLPYGYHEFYLLIPSLNSENNINQDLRSPERDEEGGLSEEVVAKYLKTRRNNDQAKTNQEDESKICVVCQDELGRENQAIGILKCGHEYHASCIKSWLQQKNICPLCKAIAL